MTGSAARPSDPVRGLTGGWSLDAVAVTRDDGVAHPFGRAPSGHILYAPDGQMSVHLVGDAATAGAAPGHVGYYGSYTVDPDRSEVAHHIAGGSLPALIGTTQVRHVAIDGARLRLTARNGARGETRIDWRRAGPPPADDTPPGFAPLVVPGAFPDHLGPLFVRDWPGDHPLVGVRVRADHANSERVAHGGFLLAFADVALTMTLRGVTLGLNADFLRPVPAGSWIEARIATRKRSAHLIFAEAIVTADTREVLRAGGLFKPFEANA